MSLIISLVMAVVNMLVFLPYWVNTGMFSLVIALVISSFFLYNLGGRIVDENEANGVYEYTYPERYRSR